MEGFFNTTLPHFCNAFDTIFSNEEAFQEYLSHQEGRWQHLKESAFENNTSAFPANVFRASIQVESALNSTNNFLKSVPSENSQENYMNSNANIQETYNWSTRNFRTSDLLEYKTNINHNFRFIPKIENPHEAIDVYKSSVYFQETHNRFSQNGRIFPSKEFGPSITNYDSKNIFTAGKPDKTFTGSESNVNLQQTYEQYARNDQDFVPKELNPNITNGNLKSIPKTKDSIKTSKRNKLNVNLQKIYNQPKRSDRTFVSPKLDTKTTNGQVKPSQTMHFKKKPKRSKCKTKSFHKRNSSTSIPQESDPKTTNVRSLRLSAPTFYKRKEKKSIVCETCGKDFKWRSHFIIHRRSHTGERPFTCYVCKKTYTQHGALNRHRRLKHSKKKQFTFKKFQIDKNL